MTSLQSYISGSVLAVPFQMLLIGLAPFISTSAWTAVSCVMAVKGGDYLTVFSVGGTLTLSFAFINDALFQAVMTSASILLRERDYSAIKRLIFHAISVSAIAVSLLTIPFLISPEILLRFFFPSLSISGSVEVLFLTCYSSLLFLFCQGFLSCGKGLLAATRQTLFFVFTGSLQWITNYSLVFVAMNRWHWQATTFWVLISTNATIIGTLYFLKAMQSINLHRRQELLE